MVFKCLKIVFFVVLLMVCNFSIAKSNYDQQHIKVCMRMIGHKILLASGDSLSRVLNVETDSNRYKIQFESEFRFNPNELTNIVGGVVEETKIANGYIVEVQKCQSTEIVYAYEVGDMLNMDVIPCGTRDQPKSCYDVFITLNEKDLALNVEDLSVAPNNNYFLWFILLLMSIGLIVLVLFLRKKRQVLIVDDNDLIQFGDFKFDTRNMVLWRNNEKTELTSKESDLLLLLYTAVNKVVERDVILNSVWGDEGDYVGRTLDVFISKLRKKIAEDEKVKIVNVRGVGYKFIVN